MLKLPSKLMLLVTLSSLLLCQTVSGDPSQEPNLSCLTRQQKESIETCFEENHACHLTIDRMTEAPQISSSWQTYLMLGLSGFVGGIVAAQQLRH